MINKQQYESIPDNDRFNVVFEGTAYFASIHTPKAGYKGKGKLYEVSLGLDDKGVEKANKYGLRVYSETDSIPMPHIKIRRKIDAAKGQTAESVKPEVVDSKLRSIPSNILIGNGSKVRVKFATFWWGDDEMGDDPSDPDGGVGTTMFKVQVVDLVRFENGDDLGEVDGGFSLDDETSIANEAPAKKVTNGGTIFDD